MKKPFNERWAEIEPLLMQKEPRLSLSDIGRIIGVSPSQVSRIKQEAVDRGLTDDTRLYGARRSVYRGMCYGSISRALLPHALQNAGFNDWVSVEASALGITVSELAMSALVDVYYEETQTD